MNKIRNTIVKSFVRKTLATVGLLRLFTIVHSFTAIVWHFSFQKVERKGKSAVIIDHHFAQDIDALKRQAENTGINLIRLPYWPLFQLAGLFFPDIIREGSYFTEDMERCKIRYRRCLRNLFVIWKPESRIVAFLTPSDSFFWIREIIILLQEKGIPCIVLDKEGTISPDSMENFSRQIAEYYPFISDAIIVWSERQKTFWMKAGVHKDAIFVEGQPRSDFYFDSRRWPAKKNLPVKTRHYVLFFTFETDAYAPTPGMHIWRQLRNEIHGSLIRFAEKYPDISFVVKTHPQQTDAQEVEEEFQRYNLRNLIVLHGPEVSRHLTIHADLIIGFQTTALIEAMLLAKKVIYTQWTDEVVKHVDKLIPFHTAKGIHVASSLTEFESLLDGLLEARNFVCLPEEYILRKRFTEIYMHQADGNSSMRVLGRVVTIIEQQRKSANRDVIRETN